MAEVLGGERNGGFCQENRTSRRSVRLGIKYCVPGIVSPELVSPELGGVPGIGCPRNCGIVIYEHCSFRISLKSGNSILLIPFSWIPAFAGMTNYEVNGGAHLTNICIRT
jgi:hypothetical protein